MRKKKMDYSLGFEVLEEGIILFARSNKRIRVTSGESTLAGSANENAKCGLEHVLSIVGLRSTLLSYVPDSDYPSLRK